MGRKMWAIIYKGVTVNFWDYNIIGIRLKIHQVQMWLGFRNNRGEREGGREEREREGDRGRARERERHHT